MLLKESSVLTGGCGGMLRLLAENMGAAASKRGNSFTVLPLDASPYGEQCQGGSEKFCDDMRV